MTAAQQVFDVAELLEIIICQCVPYQIHELKQVARSWRDMISTSRAVKRATVLETFEDSELDDIISARTSENTYVEMLQEVTSVTYASTDWIRLNPRLAKVHYYFGQYPSEGNSCYNITLVLPTRTRALAWNEYLTHPPIRECTMSACHWDGEKGDWMSKDNLNVCTAYNPAGLKIKDLLAVRDDMIATQRIYLEDPEVFDLLIHPSIEIQGEIMTSATREHRELDSLYFNGCPPRYRKASHRPSLEFEKMKLKDRRLEWHPSTNIGSSSRYWS